MKLKELDVKLATRSSLLLAIALAAVVGQALAAPLPNPEDTGGGDGTQTNAIVHRCLQSVTGDVTGPSDPIRPGSSATISWSVRVPANCLKYGNALYLDDVPV